MYGKKYTIKLSKIINNKQKINVPGLGLPLKNNPNKYGSGNRGDYGLTEEGKLFLKKAIDSDDFGL